MKTANCCSWNPLSAHDLRALEIEDNMGGRATELEQVALALGKSALMKAAQYVESPVVEIVRPVKQARTRTAGTKAHPWDARFVAILSTGALHRDVVTRRCRDYSLMQDKYLKIEISRAVQRGIIRRNGERLELC